MRAVIAIAMTLGAASVVQASTAIAEPSRSAAALEQLAAAKFGSLSRAEQRLVRGAISPNLPWAGASADRTDPTNDPAHGDKWGAERSIRAALLSWLCTDPDAVRYIHPSGLGIAGARIDGPIEFSYSKLRRPLTLVRCYIPAGIDLSNAQLQALYVRESRTGPIVADLATIAGDVGLRYGSYDSASFFRSHIGGNLDCTGAHFSNSKSGAFSAVAAVIAGDALFHGFTTNGIVDLRLARIEGSLSLNDVVFSGKGNNGLNAERAAVGGPLYWVNIRHNANTLLDLENTRAGALWDDEASQPAPGNLDVEGFVYGGISGGPIDASRRLRWLSLQPAGYHPQPYRQLATVLRDRGEDAGATDVLIAKEVARPRHGSLSRPERLWNMLLEVTIGYGYRPLRALWWIISFVAFGTALFGIGYRARIVAPSEESAYHSFVNGEGAPPHYPPFNAFVYSLDNFLPVVDLHQGLYWRPNPHQAVKQTFNLNGHEIRLGNIPGSLLRWYLWFHILAGWTLTPLLFAGLSGLIRME